MTISPNRVVVPATLILVGLAGLVLALAIPASYDGSTAARILPVTVSATLVVLGAADLWHGLGGERAKTERDGAPTRPVPASAMAGTGGVLGLLILTVLYLAMVAKIGYLLSTALAAPAALALFGIRSPLGLLVSAVVCPLVYHLIFFKLIGIFPPYGAWFDLLDVFPGI